MTRIVGSFIVVFSRLLPYIVFGWFFWLAAFICCAPDGPPVGVPLMILDVAAIYLWRRGVKRRRAKH
jgi:membrane protein implicated in regulation of membrane protease activity